MSSEPKNNGRLASYAIILLGAASGIAVAHIVYFLQACIEGERFVMMHPGASYVIHYGNLPHMQALLYGILGGTVAGAILAWAIDAFKKRKR